MIEGGNAGGSAQQQAADRRAQAERLQAEAARLDVVAGDERAMAGRLATLPESYVILHDLTLPDRRGRVDHVVIGPGGAFLVLTRRVDAEVSYAHGQLAAGGAMLGGMIDAARVEAQALTAALGTPVVPVIGFVGAALAADVPAAVAGALVCDASQVAPVVGRGSHTLLPATKVREVADKAVALLTVPGTRARQQPGAGTLPPPPPVPVTPVAADAAPVGGLAGRFGSAGLDRRQGDRRASTPEHSKHSKHSRRFFITAVVSACLVAFAAGGLLRVLFADDPVSSSPSLTAGSTLVGSTLPGGSTTIELPTSVPAADATTVPAPVAFVAPPKVAVLPVCQTPGTGWSLVPAWPGDVAGLARYDVEVLGADGQWAVVSSFPTKDTVVGAITGQQPNVTLTVRFIAVMGDGSRSPGTPTPIVTPATAC